MRLTIPGLLLLLLLAGCQASGALDTLRAAFRGSQPSSSALNPAFQYLRLTVGKDVVFMALGYLEPHPQGEVEVWFSATREVLRLQDGRLTGITGTFTEWQQVRMPVLPSWRTLAQFGQPHAWERIRDVMPGYRHNVTDRLELRRVDPPANSALIGIAPATLTWFEEARMRLPAAGDAQNHLPPARYAVDLVGHVGGQVVYAEQCISGDFCMSWQRWRAGQ